MDDTIEYDGPAWVKMVARDGKIGFEVTMTTQWEASAPLPPSPEPPIPVDEYAPAAVTEDEVQSTASDERG